MEFAKLMDGRADLLHVSACNFYFLETECLMVPGMFKEGPQPLPGRGDQAREALPCGERGRPTGIPRRSRISWPPGRWT